MSNKTTKCCTNQRVLGEDCQDCWNGTYGNDCKHKCPQNRYGRFCLNRCNCAANESCHYATGCNITTGNMRERDLGAEEEEDFGTEDDGSLWIKIPGISLGVIVIILIGIFIFIRIKMRTGRKWDNFVQGNPLSSNLHAGASVTTLLSTTSFRKEDKPKVKVSDYPTLKASQDVDKCFDSYHTIRRDDFHQNRRSIPIFFRRSTDRNKLKSSTLPVSGLRSNFQGGNTGDVYLIKKPEKHSKEDFRGNGNDTGQHVLHKVESGGQFTYEQNMTSNAQDTDSKSNQNAVRYSLVKCV
ncbi:uncharacterized protein LOC134269626 [Saccostrea cucullata]|uniref:uncharacterized protein LOC134269626 n=1 Tax=Saccostrea cuccullata TaxID=36930 RepID=UPI002ED3A298